MKVLYLKNLNLDSRNHAWMVVRFADACFVTFAYQRNMHIDVASQHAFLTSITKPKWCEICKYNIGLITILGLLIISWSITKPYNDNKL